MLKCEHLCSNKLYEVTYDSRQTIINYHILTFTLKNHPHSVEISVGDSALLQLFNLSKVGPPPFVNSKYATVYNPQFTNISCILSAISFSITARIFTISTYYFGIIK